jgi:hypothetical protein
MADAAAHGLRVAADAYATARAECSTASDAADAAYEQLQASPGTLEYQIAWSDARKREAAAVFRARTAAVAYRLAGGTLIDDNDDRFFRRPH